MVKLGQTLTQKTLAASRMNERHLIAVYDDDERISNKFQSHCTLNKTFPIPDQRELVHKYRLASNIQAKA